jgi:broad specificity phosphatase PhoE
MLKIYIARHGQDQDNANTILNGRRNMPLTQLGIEQAQQIANKIKQGKITFDRIYSSPLVRAYETAEIISNTLGLSKLESMDELTERDFGIMTGQPYSKIEGCKPDILKTDTITYFLCPEGAETFPQLIERAKKLLSQLEADNQDKNILLVTHGDIGKMIYAAYYDLDWENVLRMFHFGNSELLELSEESSPEETHVFKIKQFNL